MREGQAAGFDEFVSVRGKGRRRGRRTIFVVLFELDVDRSCKLEELENH
jgi:hypothetical protein